MHENRSGACSEEVAALEAREVSYAYPAGFAVREVSLLIPRGDFLAIIGPNGCGKTTFLKLLSRRLIPDSGLVFWQGRSLAGFSGRQLARRLSVIPSESIFEFPFRVREVVSMGRYPYQGRLGFSSEVDREMVLEAMRLAHCRELADRPVSELSSGERQRVVLARALAQQPACLLLDEPNTHLDIRHQISMFRLLGDLNRRRRLTVVVVLHDLTMVLAFCRRVALMQEGRLLETGAPERVMTSRKLQSVYGTDVRVEEGPSGRPVVFYPSENGGTQNP